MGVATGHDVRVNYLWEDNGYAQTPNDGDYKTFGADVRFNRAEASNDPTKLFDPNDREASKIIAQRFNGSWSVEFTLTNPWWVRAVISNPTTDGTDLDGDGVADHYTHTFDGKYADTMQIRFGNEYSNDGRVLKGCVVRSCDIDVQVNDTVNVSLDGFYAEEEIVNDIGPAQDTFQQDPMTFAQAQFSLDNEIVNLTQNVSLSIENNIDPVGELGTRFTVDYAPLVRDPSISFSKIEKDAQDELQRLYGGSTTIDNMPENQAPVTLTFDNGKSGADEETLQFDVTGAFRDSYSLSGLTDPEQQLRSDINEMAESVSATATNDTENAR